MSSGRVQDGVPHAFLQRFVWITIFIDSSMILSCITGHWKRFLWHQMPQKSQPFLAISACLFSHAISHLPRENSALWFEKGLTPGMYFWRRQCFWFIKYLYCGLTFGFDLHLPMTYIVVYWYQFHASAAVLEDTLKVGVLWKPFNGQIQGFYTQIYRRLCTQTYNHIERVHVGLSDEFPLPNIDSHIPA